MSAARYKFVFCDDVRNETGGRRSLMGVLGPLVKTEDGEVSGVTIACIVDTPFGSKIPDEDVWIGLSKDGKLIRKMNFATIPPEYYAADRILEERRYVQAQEPGYEPRASVMGVLEVHGPIRFNNTLVLTSHVGDQECDRVVFFKMPATAVDSQTEQTKVGGKASKVASTQRKVSKKRTR